ncbi:hypothetical protein CSUI_009808 [Cystoisospora suis]|uniref:Uncharacterized protein n=1 Tax=Cystoisospora suis TaxID=483139 RepID=A0A2C6KIA4_9APIC|nr:hypothetical protein CSUI_009808 [Cystoisospora suis]
MRRSAGFSYSWASRGERPVLGSKAWTPEKPKAPDLRFDCALALAHSFSTTRDILMPSKSLALVSDSQEVTTLRTSSRASITCTNLVSPALVRRWQKVATFNRRSEDG